jgi:pimeloyl-ACP methyl ester carboxylesterase
MSHPIPQLCCLLALCLLSGCTPYADVRERRPEFSASATFTGPLAALRDRIRGAQSRERAKPLLALGEYLAVAEAASAKLAANPRDKAALEAYNFAVARALGVIKEGQLDPWTKPMPVPGGRDGYMLTHRPDPRPGWNPALYDFVPADQFDVRGKYVTKQAVKEGVGAPIVAMGREQNRDFEKNFGLPRTYYGVTALIRFKGGVAEIAFEDPLATEKVKVAGRTMPLAANFTVPLAVMLEQAEPQKLELTRLIWPEKYARTARISRLQPYDPEKTVVLVIHGLMDTPATWAPLINELRSDETLRRNYQFWFYSYPSGYPYAYSAAILRSQLDAAEKRFPLRKPMILMGHSMGGCISRLLVTDAGDRLWREIFGRAPADTPMSESSRRLFSDALVFKNRPEVGRVIFISAPLRGADLAVNPLGRIGSSLVRSPRMLLEAGSDAMNLVALQSGELRLRRIPNSIDTLAPNSRFVLAVNKIPIVKGVPLNVIVGDRGKGGNKDRTPPVMSDGVVPYWSSHLPQAESEKIVPSNHSAHQHPEAIKEVARILKRHAGS